MGSYRERPLALTSAGLAPQVRRAARRLWTSPATSPAARRSAADIEKARRRGRDRALALPRAPLLRRERES
eukprot:scaffold57572_cov24-Tisochrysis_lutea.AAC.1